MDKRIQNIDNTTNLHRAKFENCAKNEDIDKLFKKFNDYSPLYVIREI